MVFHSFHSVNDIDESGVCLKVLLASFFGIENVQMNHGLDGIFKFISNSYLQWQCVISGTSLNITDEIWRPCFFSLLGEGFNAKLRKQLNDSVVSALLGLFASFRKENTNIRIHLENFLIIREKLPKKIDLSKRWQRQRVYFCWHVRDQ